MTLHNNIGVNSKDKTTKVLKIAGSDHPTVVYAPSPWNPLKYPHEPCTSWN